MREITVEQFIKLQKVDLTDAYEVLSIVDNLTERQRFKLLELPYRKIERKLSRIKINNLVFDKLPKITRIGWKLFYTPSDLDDLAYGRYLDLLNLVREGKEHNFVDAVMIVYDCKRDDVLQAKASDIIPLGAFFLKSLHESENRRAELRERITKSKTLGQEY